MRLISAATLGSSAALLLFIFFCAASAAPQENTLVTEESSNASVRGNCGATTSSHGVCGPDGKLRCRAGWSGKLCDKPVCRRGCSEEYGYCTKPDECKCEKGWQGDRCDECIPLPGCQHGSCNNTSYTCSCDAGWTGTHCSQALCRSGCHITRGYCDSPGECKCRTGWGGATCDECAVTPGCQNGYCMKPLECRCQPGWTGHLCQTPVCAEGCHPDHGACSKPGECRCEVGWYGPQCSTCHPYPGCKNGHCTRPWECICEPGWTGMTCDKRIERISGYCDTNPNACLNGGTCIDVLGPRNFTCSCPSLFTGMRCDYLAERRPRPGLPLTLTTAKKIEISSTTQRSTTARKIKTTTAKPTTTTFDPFNDDDYDPGLEDYEEAPRGQHSRIHSVTASPTKLKQQKRNRESDAKNARRLFLQKQATITFRQPKFVPAIRTQSRPLKLPFTVIDRKHLSLPVFLPRVSDVIRKNITDAQNSSREDTSEEKKPDQPTTITTAFIRPGKRNRDDLSPSERRKSFIKMKQSLGSALITTTTTTTSTTTPTTTAPSAPFPPSTTTTTATTNINVSSSTSQPTSTTPSITPKITLPAPARIESKVSPVKVNSSLEPRKKSVDSLLDSPLPWKREPFLDNTKGEQTIKDLLEGYEKPQPVLVVDYDDPRDKDFNNIQKSGGNIIEDGLNFINENRRFLQSPSLNLASESSQESTSNGPSRPPMFLVAVRPIPHPDGSVRPIGAGGNPLINFSHGNYPSATFLGESRSGKFLPHGRSAGSVRGPIHFSSPSFSVSHPISFNFRHFAPQTRLSRRIGHASSVAPFAQAISEEDDLIQEEDEDSSTSASEKRVQFYEEHSDGSVHIGVDRHTPQEEILNAFIEIKKARP